jgi:ribosomal protein S18 acetylase RimI-like enzyme
MSKIVFKGRTTDGISYLIRYPKRTDVHEFWRYINELSKEKTFISFQGEDISLKDERIWVNSSLKKIREKKSVQLIIEINGKIEGVSGIDTKGRVNNHVGIFGISIAREFRGKGIGKKLIETVLEEAKKNLKHIRIIHLECFASNETACNLYKSVGFKEYGKLPGGIAYKDGFVDEILMYKEI